MSNRRKLTPPREQNPAAHLDGIHLADSCCDTVITVRSPRHGSPARWVVQHEDDCPALGPDPAAAATARRRASLAAGRLITGLFVDAP